MNKFKCITLMMYLRNDDNWHTTDRINDKSVIPNDAFYIFTYISHSRTYHYYIKDFTVYISRSNNNAYAINVQKNKIYINQRLV